MASMAQAVRSRSAVATACNSDIKYAVPRSLTTSSSQSNRRAPFSTWSVSLKRPAFAARNVTSRRVVKVDALQAMGTRLLKAIPASAKGSVFVAGAEGPVAARIIRELASSGIKVVAGFSDPDLAKAAYSLAVKYELIDKATAGNIKAVAYTDTEELEAVIPRGGRVVVVEGDSLDKRRKMDAKAVSTLVAAATDAGASDFILITNQAASRGGLFGGGGSSSVAAVAKSGLEYAVIRAPGYDRVPDAFGEGRSIVVGGAGGGVITPGAAVSGLQVAEVVRAVLQQRLPPGGAVLEVNSSSSEQAEDASKADGAAAGSDGNDQSLSSSITNVFLSIAAEYAASQQEDEQAEAEATAAAQAAASRRQQPQQRGGRAAAATAKQGNDEEDEDATAPKPGGLGGLFGFRRAAVAQQEEEEEEEEEPQPVKRAPLFAFGGGRKAAAQQQEEEEEDDAPAKPAAGLFGFGTRKVTNKSAGESASAGSSGGKQASKAAAASSNKNNKDNAAAGGTRKAERPSRQEQIAAYIARSPSRR
eukprot:jgi/Chrzof1/6435/Cz18g10170.t1_TIC62